MNFNTSKIIKGLTISIALVCIFLIGNFLYYPMSSADSGFYLSVAREIYQGKLFFVEIGSVYNPLAIMTVGLPYLFNVEPNLRYHLAVNIAIHLFCAFFFYKLIQKFSNKKEWNLLISSFFLLLLLYNDGRYIILEPFSVLFQLLALIWFVNYTQNPNIWKIVLTGFFISLSFLSKQYGLFIALPIGIGLLLSKNDRVKQLIGVTIGFCFPLIVLYLFLQTKSFGFIDFIKSILGKGAKLDIGNGTGLELDLKSIAMFVLIFIVTNLYVILLPFYISRIRSSKYFLVLITALLSSFLVLYFAFYLHYFIYVIPYFLLLFTVINSNTEIKTFQLKALSLFLISILLIVFSVTTSFENKREIYYSQQNYSTDLNKLVPSKSNVYLDGVSPAYYYLCNYNSIHSKNVGYCFPGYLFSSTIVNNLKKGDYVIATKDNYKSYANLIKNFKVTKSTIANDELYIIQK